MTQLRNVNLLRSIVSERPNLPTLSYCLRDQGTWPDEFHWDFGNTHHCAMGLAHSLWNRSVPKVRSEDAIDVMSRVFRISRDEADGLFFAQGYAYLGLFRRPHRAVTPTLVANNIDMLLSYKAGRRA